MDKRLLKLFEDMSKENDKVIKNYEKIVPMSMFMIKTDKKPKVILSMLPVNNGVDKEVIRNLVKSIAVKTENLIGYIVMYDSIMTKYDDKTKAFIGAYDTVVRSVYTNTEKKTVLVPHKDKVILTDMIIKIEGRDDSTDRWDVWNSKDINEYNKISNEYDKHKKENPNVYKDV